MKKHFALIFGALSMLIFAGNAVAQTCTDNLKSTIQACVEDGVDACANATTACNAFLAAYTVGDAIDDAVETCCTRESTKSRKSCLRVRRRTFKNKIGVAKPRAKTPLPKDFAKEVRTQIGQLIKSDCNNNAYAQLF